MKFYSCNQQDVLAAFSHRYMVPSNHRTDPSSFQTKFKRKHVATTFPSEREQLRMRDLEQGTPEWLKAREPTYGGSSCAAMGGYEQTYGTNVSLFYEESGRKPIVASSDPNNYLPLDRGHYWENEVAQLYCALMSAKHYEVGLIRDHSKPFTHISPDGLCELTPNLIHNRYTINDGCRIGLEIKNPIHQSSSTKKSHTNTIPCQYIPQLLLQMQTFCWTAVDFMNSWKCNELSQPINLESKGYAPGIWLVGETRLTRMYRNKKAANRVYQWILTHMAKLNKKDVLLPYPDITTTGHQEMGWLVGKKVKLPSTSETLTVYIEEDIQETNDPLDETIAPEILYGGPKLQLNSGQFRHDDDTGDLYLFPGVMTQDARVVLHQTWTEAHTHWNKYPRSNGLRVRLVYVPKKIFFNPNDPVFANFPPITMLPLKTLRFLCQTEMLSDGTYPNPAQADGFLHGEITVEIQHFFEQKPIVKNMKQLWDKSDDFLSMLDEVPPPEPLPEFHEIRNQIWKHRMKLMPDKKLSDIIWEFAIKTEDPEITRQCIEMEDQELNATKKHDLNDKLLDVEYTSQHKKQKTEQLPKTSLVRLRRKADGTILQDCDVYIGRKCTQNGWDLPSSIFHNPFTLSSCNNSAELAVKKFQEYFENNEQLKVEAIKQLKGKVLGCWCKKKGDEPCHGDVLVHFVENQNVA